MDIIEITTEKQDAFSRVTVRGEIDAHTCWHLREALTEAIDTNLDLIVDITKVAYIDSSGIGVLVGASKRCGNTGRHMIIVCSNENSIIHKIFRMVGLETFFTTVLTVDAAVQELNERAAKASQH